MLMPEDIELFWRIQNNPYKRNGLRFEDALCFCDEVRHELAKLDERTQFILQAEAAGFSYDEMAKICMVSRRTLARWVAAFRGKRRYDA